MSDELLINVNINGEQQVDDLEKKVDKLGKTTSRTVSEMQKTRKALRDAKSDMLAAEEGTEEYSRALARASALQLKLKETNDKVRLGIKDFGETAKNVGQSIAGLSGGFTATMGVMGLFAGENENLAKAILGVQSALAVTQGLATFADSIDNMRDLWQGLTASMGASKGVIGEVGTVAANSSDEVGKLAGNTAVLSSNLAGATVTTSNLSDSFNKLSQNLGNSAQSILENEKNLDDIISILSKGVPAEVAGLDESLKKDIKTMNEYIDVMSKKEELSFTELQTLSKTKKLREDYTSILLRGDDDYQELLKNRIEAEKQLDIVLFRQQQSLVNGSRIQAESVDLQNAMRDSRKSRIAEENYLNKVIEKNVQFEKDSLALGEKKITQDGKFVESTEKVTDGLEEATKATGSMASSIGKALISMAAFMAIIGLITFGISKLIEMINKVPEDVKIKLELEENVSKDIQKELEKINKIRHNLTRVSNEEELKLIKEKLIQEGVATEEQLKNLNNAKAILNAAFWDSYLKNVRLVAENEYLVRRDVELRLQKELAEERAKQLAISSNFLQRSFGEASKAREEMVKLQREYKEFQNLFYRNGKLKLNPVSFDLGKTTTTTGGGGGGGGLPKDKEEIPYYLLLDIDLQKSYQRFKERVDEMVQDILKDSAGADAKENLSKTIVDKFYNPKDFTDSFNKIDDKREEFVQDERDAFETLMDTYQSYATSLATIADAISYLYDTKLDNIQRYYDAEAALVEQSLMSEEQKNLRLSELDKKRYEEQKVLFEQQKKWREAMVYLDLASGLMGIYTRATSPTAAPSPFNWIAAGLEATAIVAQSAAQISAIRSQQLDAPSNTSSGSGSVSSVVALSPTKTALTSREENLNMMSKSGESNQVNVVKVSDINDVQNKVKVRETNSTF